MSANPNKIITLQELINAQVDAYKLELIMNEAPWVEITTRLERKCYSIATIQGIIDQYKIKVDTELAGLQEVIDTALAAGAGAAGWTDRLVQTWSGRTQEQKNKDSIHVLDFKIGKTDQQAIQDAVNYCIANEKSLNWDGAHLVSTANIDNFWNVTHVGAGSVTRGSNTFKISKRSSDFTDLYVAPSGSHLNDGLSPDYAVAKLATVGVILSATTPSQRMGEWRINFAAGTYGDSYNFISLPQFQKPIRFLGTGTRYNPETIFDGNLSSYKTAGIYWLSKARVFVQYLKFQNFPNGYGLLVERNCEAEYADCMAVNCNIGFSGGYNSFVRSERCIAEDCTTGFRGASNACASYTPRSNSLADANIVRRCTNGMLLTRNSYGHFDFNYIEDCTRGILIEMNSRGATIRNDLKRCTVGIAGWTNGFVSSVDTNNFNLGTADACERTIQWRGGSGDTATGQNFTGEYSHEYLTNSPTFTGSTEHQMVTNGVLVEGRWFVEKSARLKMKVIGTVTTTAGGNYNIQPRFAGSTLSTAQVPSSVTNQPFIFECEVIPLTASTQKTISRLTVNGLPPVVSMINTSITVHLTQDVRFNLYVDIGGSAGAGASTITIDSVVVTRSG